MKIITSDGTTKSGIAGPTGPTGPTGPEGPLNQNPTLESLTLFSSAPSLLIQEDNTSPGWELTSDNGNLQINNLTDSTNPQTILQANTELLTINAATSLDGAVTINDSGSNVNFRIASDVSTHAFFIQGSNGNIGINNSTPASNSGFSNALELTQTTDGWDLMFNNPSAGTSTSIGAITANRDSDVLTALLFSADGATDSGVMRFFTQPTGGALTERMRIDSNGNVGIGGTPVSDWDGRYAVQFGDKGSLSSTKSGNPNVYLTANLAFDDPNWEYLSGYIGGMYQIDRGWHYWYTTTDATQSAGATATLAQRMSLDTGGRLYLPSLLQTTYSGLTVEIDTANGGLYVETSTRKTKTNIRDVDGKAWNDIYSLRVRCFDSLDGKHNGMVGLVAEEAAQINPRFVVFDGEGAPLGIDRKNILYALVKCQQDHRGKLQTAKAKVQELESRIAALEAANN